MIMYRTGIFNKRGCLIECVKVENTTAAFVHLMEDGLLSKQALRSKGRNYYTTQLDAHAALSIKARHRLTDAENRLRMAKDYYRNAHAAF